VGFDLGIGGLLYHLANEITTGRYPKTNRTLQEFAMFNLARDPFAINRIHGYKRERKTDKTYVRIMGTITGTMQAITDKFVEVFGNIGESLLDNYFEVIDDVVSGIAIRDMGIVEITGHRTQWSKKALHDYLLIRERCSEIYGNSGTNDIEALKDEDLLSFAGLDFADVVSAYQRIAASINTVFKKTDEEVNYSKDRMFVEDRIIKLVIPEKIKIGDRVPSKINSFLKMLIQTEIPNLMVTIAGVVGGTQIPELFRQEWWIKSWLMVSAVTTDHQAMHNYLSNTIYSKFDTARTAPEFCAGLIKTIKTRYDNSKTITMYNKELTSVIYRQKVDVLRLFVSSTYYLYYFRYAPMSDPRAFFNSDVYMETSRLYSPRIFGIAYRLPYLRYPLIYHTLMSNIIEVYGRNKVIAPELTLDTSVFVGAPTWKMLDRDVSQRLFESIALSFKYMTLYAAKAGKPEESTGVSTPDSHDISALKKSLMTINRKLFKTKFREFETLQKDDEGLGSSEGKIIGIKFKDEVEKLVLIFRRIFDKTTITIRLLQNNEAKAILSLLFGPIDMAKAKITMDTLLRCIHFAATNRELIPSGGKDAMVRLLSQKYMDSTDGFLFRYARFYGIHIMRDSERARIVQTPIFFKRLVLTIFPYLKDLTGVMLVFLENEREYLKPLDISYGILFPTVTQSKHGREHKERKGELLKMLIKCYINRGGTNDKIKRLLA